MFYYLPVALPEYFSVTLSLLNLLEKSLGRSKPATRHSVAHSRTVPYLTTFFFNGHKNIRAEVYRHWWRSAPALVAQCTGTGGAVYRHWWRSVTGTGGSGPGSILA